MAEQDDKVTIKKLLAGEVNALQVIVGKYKRQGFNLAYRICRNRENAEEILQNVFISIYQNLAQFNFKGEFSTWFYRIVYNQSISYLRKIKNSGTSLNEFEGMNNVIDEEKTIEEIMSRSEAVHYLEQALIELEPDETALLHLYYYDDKRISEISEITGLNDSAIKTRLFRTRKKLYSILERLLKKEFVDFYG